MRNLPLILIILGFASAALLGCASKVIVKNCEKLEAPFWRCEEP